jgi:hypothetical protein
MPRQRAGQEGMNMTDSMASEKYFKLIWTSQNEVVELECGEYASIPEAAADKTAAEARLIAQHGATFRNLHDIKAGRWRVVPIEAIRPLRQKHAGN